MSHKRKHEHVAEHLCHASPLQTTVTEEEALAAKKAEKVAEKARVAAQKQALAKQSRPRRSLRRLLPAHQLPQAALWMRRQLSLQLPHSSRSSTDDQDEDRTLTLSLPWRTATSERSAAPVSVVIALYFIGKACLGLKPKWLSVVMLL